MTSAVAYLYGIISCLFSILYTLILFLSSHLSRDLEHPSAPMYTVAAHSKIINCIDGAGGKWGVGAPEIVTGSRDGCVHVWDPRQERDPVMSLVPPEDSDKKPDCWAVAFGFYFPYFVWYFFSFSPAHRQFL